MTTQDDVRRIALSLPEVVEAEGHFSFSVVGKAFVWIYLERVHPKKARVSNPEAVAMSISGEEEKATLLLANPEIFFTTDHYNGYAAILVHLSRIEPDALEDVLTDA
ncbi:MAG: MmcQ/YjbR family DNA-binding protein [Thermomicrobiales bacterium]